MYFTALPPSPVGRTTSPGIDSPGRFDRTDGLDGAGRSRADSLSRPCPCMSTDPSPRLDATRARWLAWRASGHVLSPRSTSQGGTAMAVKVLELHHHGIRVRPDETEKSLSFYRDVLGLSADAGRPSIPGIPGYWVDCGNDTQIHIMGAEGMSRYAQGPGQDPTRLHVALAIPDVQEAKTELDRLGVPYW